jgi:hypothetical protein
MQFPGKVAARLNEIDVEFSVEKGNGPTTYILNGRNVEE